MKDSAIPVEAGEPSDAQGVRAELEARLLESERLEAVGRLAAGVAHEINTPVQYISDAAHFGRDAAVELLRLVTAQQAVIAAVCAGEAPEVALAELLRLRTTTDFAFIHAELIPALDSILEGVARVGEIVRGMKELSHPGGGEARLADLNHVISSAVRMARHATRHIREIRLELGALPPVPCRAGDLGKVVVNLVLNACDAILDSPRADDGWIRIASRIDGDRVVIEIEDNGVGVPAELKQRVFDPFFTTKAVGRGTGQGLALARRIVEDQHGGRISVAGEACEGSTFRIELPLSRRAVEEKA